MAMLGSGRIYAALEKREDGGVGIISLFSPEDEEKIFLRNVGILTTILRGTRTQNNSNICYD